MASDKSINLDTPSRLSKDREQKLNSQSESDNEKKYTHYIVDGKTYDLREWISKHPGGAIWFAVSKGRDISVAIHAYHKHPERIKAVLAKYEVDTGKPLQESQDPSLNIVNFILPPDFDARKHTPTYHWNNPDDFLNSLRKKLDGPEMKVTSRPAPIYRAFDRLCS